MVSFGGFNAAVPTKVNNSAQLNACIYVQKKRSNENKTKAEAFSRMNIKVKAHEMIVKAAGNFRALNHYLQG